MKLVIGKNIKTVCEITHNFGFNSGARDDIDAKIEWKMIKLIIEKNNQEERERDKDKKKKRNHSELASTAQSRFP